jgi:hypothetical protein
LKKDEGNWVKTEYAGDFPKISLTFLSDVYRAKKDAEILCSPVTEEHIVEKLSAPLQIETSIINMGGDPPTFVELQFHVGGVQFVPIKGNFSESIVEAEKYASQKSNYGGYNLINNNCLHYVRDILSLGTASDIEMEKCIEKSISIIPMNFYSELNVIK